jgi:putative transposase
VNVAVVIAVGVNVEGHREVLGFDAITTEDGAGWLAFLRGLVARGLAGTTLVISDAHAGLVDAVRSTLTGATWQRSLVHHPPWRSVTVETSGTGGRVPPVTPRRRERALAA